jgi:hypothetical protein
LALSLPSTLHLQKKDVYFSFDLYYPQLFYKIFVHFLLSSLVIYYVIFFSNFLHSIESFYAFFDLSFTNLPSINVWIMITLPFAAFFSIFQIFFLCFLPKDLSKESSSWILDTFHSYYLITYRLQCSSLSFTD